MDGARDLPPRQRTLRTAIGTSYALLNEAERLLFRMLGVFVGGFALERSRNAYRRSAGTRYRSSYAPRLAWQELGARRNTAAGEQRFLLLETIREFAAGAIAGARR